MILNASSGFTNYSWNLLGGAVAGASLDATLLGSLQFLLLVQIIVFQHPLPVIIQAGNSAVIDVTANGPLSFCSGQEVILTAEDGYSNYQWP